MAHFKPMKFLRTRLAINMFLEFATWGAWFPILGNYLTQIGFSNEQIALVYGTGALSTMVSPLVAGQIADRWLATETFLAISHLISAAFFFLAASATQFWPVYGYCFGAMFFYMPTMGLSNSLTMQHLKDSKRSFPRIRSFGTIGWIIAGLIMSRWFHINPSRPIGDCLRAGGIYAIVQGVFSFFLPSTPPAKKTKERFAIGEAFAMMKEPSCAVFIVLSFFLMFVLNFYYIFAGKFFEVGLKIPVRDVPNYLAIGQGAEIMTLAILPFIHRSLGTKKTIAVGIICWGARYGAYILGQPFWLVLMAQALHGACFGFVFVMAMVYVDMIAPSDARASAQSFLSFVTYGAGMFISSLVISQISKLCALPGNGLDYKALFMYPFFASIVILAIFLFFFYPKENNW